MATTFREPIDRRFKRVIEARSRPLARVINTFFQNMARKEIARRRKLGQFKLSRETFVLKIEAGDQQQLIRILDRFGQVQAREGKTMAAQAMGQEATPLTPEESDEITRSKAERVALILLGLQAAMDQKINEVLEGASLQDDIPGEATLAREARESLVVEGPLSEARATRIARTETSASNNLGTFAALTAAAATAVMAITPPGKMWVAVGDNRTRSTHVTLSGQIQPLDIPFKSSSGAELRFPGDPQAPIAETINCRCIVVPA